MKNEECFAGTVARMVAGTDARMFAGTFARMVAGTDARMFADTVGATLVVARTGDMPGGHVLRRQPPCVAAGDPVF